MKRITLLWLTLSLVLCALVALPAHRAMADNETDELEMRVEGTLDAADCTAQTISVMGFTIGIGGARIDTTGGVCTDLVVTEQVRVKLFNDISSATGKLRAGRVIPTGNSGSPPRIQAPIQAKDASGNTLTLLGVSVDISQGLLEGMDDHGTDTGNVPADPSQLIVGQFVQVKLAAGTPPFIADEVEIENFKNEVEVELEDEHGVEIHDLSDDIEIEVHNHTIARVPAHTSPTDGALVAKKRTRRFHTSSDGKFTLHGMFTGEAKIIVERHHGGKRTHGKRVARIKSDKHGHLRIRLHK